jgi:hypothetical protein
VCFSIVINSVDLCESLHFWSTCKTCHVVVIWWNADCVLFIDVFSVLIFYSHLHRVDTELPLRLILHHLVSK